MGQPSHRLQVVLPPKAYQRLEALVELTEASSMAEVIREALRLYEAVMQEADLGASVEIVRSNGERVKVLT